MTKFKFIRYIIATISQYFLLINNCFSQAIEPVVYYTFDSPNPLNNYIGNSTYVGGTTNTLNNLIGSYNQVANPTAPPINNTHFLRAGATSADLHSENIDPATPANLFSLDKEFSMEFMFRINKTALNESQRKYVFFSSSECGKNIKTSLSFLPVPTLNAGFSYINSASAIVSETIEIPLDGMLGERGCLDYYLDGNWHHFALRVKNDDINIKIFSEIWIDGQSPPEFRQTTDNKSGTIVNPDGQSCNVTEHGIKFFSGDYLLDKFIGDFDEFAFYNQWIDESQICEHFKNAILDKDHYKKTLSTSCSTTDPIYNPVLDYLEFADGHDYTNNIGDNGSTHKAEGVTNPAIYQLKSFPAPRFQKGVIVHPNMNWMNSKYMGGYKRETDNNAEDNSLVIQEELATNWNYLFNVLEDPSDYGDFANNVIDGFADKWADYAKDKLIPLAVITNRSHINPSIIGAPINEPYLEYQGFTTNADIEEYYIIDNQTGNSCPVNCPSPATYFYNQESGVSMQVPTGTNHRKFWNPSANPNNFIYDGQTMSEIIHSIYIKTPGFNRKLSYIAENNEPAGITAPYSGSSGNSPPSIPHIFENSCDVVCEYLSSGFPGNGKWEGYLATKRKYVDIESYRNYILNTPNIGKPLYLQYGVDADGANNFYTNRYNWPIYREVQTRTNEFVPYLNNFYLSTPDYYPANSTYWRTVEGARRGWQWFTQCRNKEYAAGDLLYAPFVSAGWFRNENFNMRPAQYLGGLKTISLLGAAFFQSGFFNINGPYTPTNFPSNPKGYIWQAAYPSYAQALISRTFKEYYEGGKIMDGDMPLDFDAQNPTDPRGYSFKSNHETRQLIVVRQRGNGNTPSQFLIAGSIQPNGNQVGNTPLTDQADFHLQPTNNGTINLKFPIRRQGSTYIFDNTNPADPAFWQLDAWHQYEHPERWSKDFAFEAEVLDNLEAIATRNPLPGIEIHTEDNATIHTPITNGVYNNFTSYVAFTTPSPLEHRFQPRNDGIANDYLFYLKARTASNGDLTGFTVTLTDLTTNTTEGNWKSNCISTNIWEWYAIDECSGTPINFSNLLDDHEYLLSIVPMNTLIEIDQVYLAAPTSTFNPTPISSCSYDVTISQNSNIDNYYSSPVVNQRIYIEPYVILTINKDMQFINCLFTVGTGSAIVSNNVNLITNNCSFSSCSDMWYGIAGNGGTITLNNSTIQDGSKAAINGYSNHVFINNSLFDKNLMATRLYNSTIAIANSNYDCSGNLRNPYTNLKADSHNKTYNTIVQVQNSVFRNAFEGIFKSGTGNLTVSDCNFNRHNYGVICYPVGQPILTVENSNFTCGYLTNGDMEANSVAISAWGSINTKAELHFNNNSITDHQRPILVLNNDGNTTSEINGNKITLNQTIDNLQLAGQDYRGIKLENCLGINLNDNTVEWTKNPNDAGNYGDMVQGIFLYNTQSTNLTQNKISKAGYGIRFMSDCSATELHCNTMENCFNGVYLDGSGVTTSVATQGYNGGSAANNISWQNKWVNDNSTAIRVDGNNIISQPLWMYKTPDEFSPNPCNTAIISPTLANNIDGCTAPSMMSALMRDASFGDVAHDTIVPDPDSSYFKYADKETYFKVMKTDPSLLNLGVSSDANYQNIYNSINESNIGKFDEVNTVLATNNVNSALSKLIAIQDLNNIETNKKFALNTYINYFADTVPPDSTVLLDLAILANTHSFYGGVAVHWARGMIRKDIEDKFPQLRRGVKTTPFTNPNIEFQGTLQPNPADKSVLITFNNPLEDQSTLRIYDCMSNLKEEIMLDKNTLSYNVNTQNYTSGIYSFSIYSSCSFIKLQRVIINH